MQQLGPNNLAVWKKQYIYNKMKEKNFVFYS